MALTVRSIEYYPPTPLPAPKLGMTRVSRLLVHALPTSAPPPFPSTHIHSPRPVCSYAATLPPPLLPEPPSLLVLPLLLHLSPSRESPLR